MGKLIVLDGLDGSGKGTQTALLHTALAARGLRVMEVSFPRYGTKGAAPVEAYLSGELGQNPSDTNAYAASVFFGIDRYISYRTEWRDFLAQPDTVVLANRYTTANAVHQLSKMPRDAWDSFLSWLWDFEFCKLGLPKPALVLYLEMTPEISHMLVNKRSAETGQVQDIHECDPNHLTNSYAAAMYASERLGWTRIRCYQDSAPRPVEKIAAEILNIADGVLSL